jgi:hypothetical protein
MMHLFSARIGVLDPIKSGSIGLLIMPPEREVNYAGEYASETRAYFQAGTCCGPKPFFYPKL